MFRPRVAYFVFRSFVTNNYQVGRSLLIQSATICPPTTTVVRRFGASGCLWEKPSNEEDATENQRGSVCETLRDLAKHQNLRFIFGCDEKRARGMLWLCPNLVNVPIHEVRARRDYLLHRGVRPENIHEMPWLLMLDSDLFELILKEVMSILEVDFDYALPFINLDMETYGLERIRETWMMEKNFHPLLREGKMKNRLEILETEMGLKRDNFIMMLARDKRVAEWNLEELLEKSKLLKEAGVKMDDVAKDPGVLNLSMETIKSRISIIQPYRLEEIRPWMLRSLRAWEDYIRRWTKLKELAAHLNQISLLELNIIPQNLKKLTPKQMQCLRHHTATELTSKIQYLQDKGYTLELIKRHIRVLTFNKNTIEVRYNELRRYKSCCPPKLGQLFLYRKGYKSLLKRLDAAEQNSNCKRDKEDTDDTPSHA